VTERVGVIGLGLMGRPMAERLLSAGHEVVVHNRSRGAIDALARQGARPAASPAEVARAVDVVITMLPDPATVEAVVLGGDGVADAAPAETLLIDMSTSSPALAVRIQARHAASVDAPVSGGVTGTRDGTLSIMVGGEEAAVERARPVMRALGSRITHVGPPGAGQIVKAANQLVVALNIQAVAEALSLAREAGVDPAVVREALRGGFADSRVLDEHGARMLAGDFEPGASLAMHLKDLRIALELAARHGVTLPAAEQVAAQVMALVDGGAGERDHSALLLAYEPAAARRTTPTRFVHTGLRVRDPERSRRFYSILGLEDRGRLNLDHGYNVYLGTPGGGEELELLVAPGREEPYDLGEGYHHMALAVELDAVLDALSSELGVEPEKPPYHPAGRDDLPRIALVHDPDGYRIELIDGGFAAPSDAQA